MNWLQSSVFLGTVAWTAPVLVLVFFSGKVRSEKISVLLKILYVPCLCVMALAFLWVWWGDGVVNLWLVPLVFISLSFFFLKILKPKWSQALRPRDRVAFFIVLSGFLTIWVVVLAYQVFGGQMVIA